MPRLVLVFSLILVSILSLAPLAAQARAPSPPTTSPNPGANDMTTTQCAVGGTACIDAHVRLCRSLGTVARLRTVSTTALALDCAGGVARPAGLLSTPTQTRNCAPGSICQCRGSSNPGYDSVYICMNGMINDCLSAGGSAVVHGIYPDVDNDGVSVAVGTCVHR